MRLAHKQALFRFAFFAAFTLVFIYKAWIAEDAFITFRAVDNFLKGYGPVWNVGERVQAYTHPLWYALLVVGVGVFKNHYWVSIALSYACLMGTLHLVFKIGKACSSPSQTAFALLVLLLSHSFMDYTSSGLENPLQYLLLCAYALTGISQADAGKRFLYTGVLYSLLFLTRPDAIVVVTPASLWFFWQAAMVCGWRRTFQLALLAAAPALAWETFSLVYYGSLVPNTALAKVNIDYPRTVLLGQAKDYFAFNLRKDPITLAMMALSLGLVAFSRKRMPQLFMAGVALHICYVCYVGADYMVGRFLSPALLVAAMAFILMADIKCSKLAVWILLFPLTFVADRSALHDNTDSLIADERQYYYPVLGALPVALKYNWIAPCPWGEYKGFRPSADAPSITIAFPVGMGGWKNGSSDYLIDMFALADPYLARLPSRSKQRPGHYLRALPPGHFDFLATGDSRFVGNSLAPLYSDVSLATKAPLWDKDRWSAIWRLNTGYYKKHPPEFNRDDTTGWRVLIDEVYIPSRLRDDTREYMGDVHNNPAVSQVFAIKTLGVPTHLSKLCSIRQEPQEEAVCSSATELFIVAEELIDKDYFSAAH